jgi:CDGSH-type Zn-finger protein
MGEAEIHVRPDGSLKVYGRVRLFDVEGNEYDIDWETLKMDGRGRRLKLCRCGGTKTPPFCDEPRTSDGFPPT